NPASAHQVGRRARQAAEQARETIAGLLDAGGAEVLFTSGATEANNLALFGLAGQPPGRILSSPIEHPSVAEPLVLLRKHGFAAENLQVDAEGVVRASSLEALLKEPVRLVTVMLANNETGALQPVAELVRGLDHSPLTTHHSPAFHTDAVQAVGKVP